MRALQYFGPKDLRFVDIADPEPKENEVLLKIRKVGICGTDLHIYSGGMHLPTPLVMGHEFVGDVVEVGQQVTKVKVGDRAVAEHVVGCGNCSYCQQGKRNLCKNPQVIGLHLPGALAEYLVVPENLVYALPEELSYDEGVLIEPLSIAVYAVKKAGLSIGDTVAVVGQGPIGLFVDQVAKDAGGTVFGFDRHDNRLSYAESKKHIYKGFNTNNKNFFEVFQEEANSDGADVVFEAVGSDTSASLSFQLARPGGRIVILGVFEHDVMVNMMHVVKKELSVFGSWTCIFAFEPTLMLLKSKRIETKELITHRYPFTDAIKAFEEATTDKSHRIKSVIEFA